MALIFLPSQAALKVRTLKLAFLKGAWLMSAFRRSCILRGEPQDDATPVC